MAGGLPEQLGHLKGEAAIAGRLIELVDDEHDETRRYGDAVYDLIRDPSLRQKLGADAATYVRQTFDQDTTLLGMFDERKVAAKSRRLSVENSPSPSAYFGISEMILDDRLLGDMQVVQRRLGEVRPPFPLHFSSLAYAERTDPQGRTGWGAASPMLCRLGRRHAMGRRRRRDPDLRRLAAGPSLGALQVGPRTVRRLVWYAPRLSSCFEDLALMGKGSLGPQDAREAGMAIRRPMLHPVRGAGPHLRRLVPHPSQL